MSRTMFSRDAMAALGRAIDARGIVADPVALLLLAHAARDLDIPSVLIDVMVDEHEVEVARIRAFAHVSCRVSAQLDHPAQPAKGSLEGACPTEATVLAECLPTC